MRLRLSPGTIARGLRNLQYTPGRDLQLPYPIELESTDYPLGTTLVGATLVIAQDFGLNPLLSKRITSVLTAAGQITNDAAGGTGALYFLIPAADLAPFRSLGPLAFEVIVTDSRGLQASLDAGALVPTVSTAGNPVDHVLVTPTAFSLEFRATQQLTATAYDVDENVLTDRFTQWSTSDPTIATVDANGVVSVVDTGAVIITANIEGKAATAEGTITTPPALALTLDWSPLVRRADLAQPLVFTSDAARGGDGRNEGMPVHNGSGLFGVGPRVTFLKSADEWGGISPVDAVMANTFGPDSKYGALTQLINQGPFDNTTAWRVDQLYGNYSRLKVNAPWNGPPAQDNQDIATWKRGIAVSLKAATPGDVGKTVRIGLTDGSLIHDDMPSTTILKSRDVVLTADFVAYYIEFDNCAQFAAYSDIQIVLSCAVDNTSFIYAAYSSWNWHAHETDDPSNWHRPVPFHEVLGVQSTFEVRNSWAPDCDSPVLFGGAARVATATAAPDSNRYYGGRALSQYTLGVGQGITTDAPYRVEDCTDVFPSNVPTKAAWLHWYIEPGTGALPLDGALVGYLHHTPSNTDYGPVPLVRDPWSALCRSNGGAFYRCRIPINLASEGRLDFTPRIVNASGRPLVFDAYRAGMTPEMQRSYGLHNCWVPSRTITGPHYGDGATEQIPNAQKIITVDEGFWIFREAVPWSLGELPTLNGYPSYIDSSNGYQPSLWQSGPYGSGDRAFKCDINTDPSGTTVSIIIAMTRGTPCPDPNDFRRWSATIANVPIPNLLAAWPAMVAFDIAVAWKNCAVVALGIGLGTGLGMTWLSSGDLFLGGLVTFAASPGLAWVIDGDTDGHMGIAADLDKVRQTQGWFQAIASGGAGSVSPTTFEASAEYHLFNRFKARQDYR